MRLIADSPLCQLQVIATNMHLSEQFGLTYKEIEADGFKIDAKVPMERRSDSPADTVDSMAQEMAGINKAFAELKPDLVVLLGDRYELLVAASVALMHKIPIAHIHGGEITEGAIDDAIRHAITKLSALHFTATEEYRQRVISMGECPQRVFNVGSLGVENISAVPLLSAAELHESLGIEVSRRTILATYHPVTLDNQSPKVLIQNFLDALSEFEDNNVIFTMPNSDPGGDEIAQAIAEFCAAKPDKYHCFKSLGLRRYLSAMNLCGVVAGNSSSGIIEAPSAHVPTVNIGTRQAGRAHGPSVINCEPQKEDIAQALRQVLSPEFQAFAKTAPNPYAQEGTAQTICDVISTVDIQSLTKKKFYTPNL